MNIEELQAAWKTAVEDADQRQADRIAAQLVEYGKLQLGAVAVHAAAAQDKATLTQLVANLTRDAVALAHCWMADEVETTAGLMGLRAYASAAEVRTLTSLVKRQVKALEEVKPRRQGPQDKEPEERVLQLLDRTDKGAPIPSLGNIVKLLEHDSRQAERWRLNEMALRLEVDGRIYQKVDASEASIWIADHYGLHVPTRLVEEAIVVVATRNPHHPIREYLDGLEWDGVERLDGMLPGYFEADGGSLELLAAYGRCWMISAVARVYQPGCKADCVLVLQGEQGARKSQALQVLAGDGNWADSHIDTRSKDGYHILIGPWLFEIAEFDKFSARDVAWLKSFFSGREDRFRKPYATQPEPVQRQCVFLGTCNPVGFLSDPTGNRRYWCAEVGRVDLEGLAAVRDQLWAEAAARYKRGEQWWLTDSEEEERRQEEGRWLEGDAWVELLQQLLSRRNWPDVRSCEICGPDYLDVPKERWPAAQRSVASALQRMGYKKVRRGSGKNRIYLWSRR